MSDDHEAQLERLERSFQEMLPDAAPVIITQLAAAAMAKKRGRGQRRCVKCGCTHIEMVDVEDGKAAESVIRMLLEYSKGRPRTMEGEGSEGVVIRRFVKGIDDAD